jgi:hypothetical protein
MGAEGRIGRDKIEKPIFSRRLSVGAVSCVPISFPSPGGPVVSDLALACFLISFPRIFRDHRLGDYNAHYTSFFPFVKKIDVRVKSLILATEGTEITER